MLTEPDPPAKEELHKSISKCRKYPWVREFSGGLRVRRGQRREVRKESRTDLLETRRVAVPEKPFTRSIYRGCTINAWDAVFRAQTSIVKAFSNDLSVFQNLCEHYEVQFLRWSELADAHRRRSTTVQFPQPTAFCRSLSICTKN